MSIETAVSFEAQPVSQFFRHEEFYEDATIVPAIRFVHDRLVRFGWHRRGARRGVRSTPRDGRATFLGVFAIRSFSTAAGYGRLIEPPS